MVLLSKPQLTVQKKHAGGNKVQKSFEKAVDCDDNDNRTQYSGVRLCFYSSAVRKKLELAGWGEQCWLMRPSVVDKLRPVGVQVIKSLNKVVKLRFWSDSRTSRSVWSRAERSSIWTAAGGSSDRLLDGWKWGSGKKWLQYKKKAPVFSGQEVTRFCCFFHLEPPLLWQCVDTADVWLIARCRCSHTSFCWWWGETIQVFLCRLDCDGTDQWNGWWEMIQCHSDWWQSLSVWTSKCFGFF